MKINKAELIPIALFLAACLWAYIAVDRGITDGRALIGFIALTVYAIGGIVREVGGDEH